MPMQTYTSDQVASAQAAALEMLEALRVLTLDVNIADWLTENDPQALKQARRAVRLATGATRKAGYDECRTCGQDYREGRGFDGECASCRERR